MRRADRLFQLVQLLRRRRAVTAAELARELAVSERTIYRDVQDLSLSGVPVEGEAGVGYRLKPGFDLPPLMFTADELQTLRLGARIVEAWGGAALAATAKSALARIESVIPERIRCESAAEVFFAPDFFISPSITAWMEEVRAAMKARNKIRIGYRTADGRDSTRIVEPLGLFFWGASWTLGAWCELRTDYRTFRLDRILSAELLPGTTVVHKPDDYIRMAGGLE